jgi:hypothetical protein
MSRRGTTAYRQDRTPHLMLFRFDIGQISTYKRDGAAWVIMTTPPRILRRRGH